MWVGFLEGSGGASGSVFRWSDWTQLGPVAAEYEIARIDVVGVGGCTVGDLTINAWVAPLRWSRFCINIRSPWEWLQRSLCMLVVMSFGCNLEPRSPTARWKGDLVKFDLEACLLAARPDIQALLLLRMTE